MVNYEVYTDGSYREFPDAKYCSYGAVVITDGDRDDVFEIAGVTENPDTLPLRNVAGELLAVVRAIQHIKSNTPASVPIGHIKIYHDYTGVAKWVTGEWQAKKPFTQRYKKFWAKEMSDIPYSFVWIKSHTGDPMNERADRLAAKAIEDRRM